MARDTKQIQPVKMAVYKGKLLPRDEVAALELKHGRQNDPAPLRNQPSMGAADIASAVVAGVAEALKTKDEKPKAKAEKPKAKAEKSETKVSDFEAEG